MKQLKYNLWITGLVAWNFSGTGAKQIYDVLAALFFKHIFELDKLFAR